MKPTASPLESIKSDAFALNPGESRIWFAQMLRGVAVLCVVFWHLGEVFWKDNAFVCKQVHLHALDLTSRPAYLGLISFLGHNRIELGDYGVALFFLISGFVIPFSLLKVGNFKFFVRRCLRIYPTYFVGLTFTSLVLLFTSQYTLIPTGITIWGFLANATLLYDLIPNPTIDGVNWTLIIEMRFYLICMLITCMTSLRSALTLAAVGAIMCASSFALLHFAPMLNSAYFINLSITFAHYAPYLIFMFVGICFHNLFAGTWSAWVFASVISFLMILFYTNSMIMPTHQAVSRLTRGYSLALATFALFFYFRDKLKPHPVLNFFAEISFPLYVLHFFAGCALMSFLYRLHSFSLLNFLETFVVFLFLAYLLHVFIEVPSNRLGHRLTHK